jgi:Tol biopolymer transport system component
MRRVLIGLVVLAGCRDAVQPFSADHYGPRSDSAAVRLTYHRGFDESPAWSANSDTVYYAASAFPGFGTGAQGVLLGIQREGGPARLMLPRVQFGITGPQYLTAPIFSRDSERAAFFDLDIATEPVTACTQTVCSGSLQGFQTPMMLRGRLRVRAPDAALDEAALAVTFAGRSFDPAREPPGGVLTLDDYPFQHKFSQFRQPVFRPSWNPDGSRLVFSTGFQLMTWQPGQPAPTPVPGTDDGVWAAWSPDGQWIAYTHLPRGNPLPVVRCQCLVIGNDVTDVIETRDRIGYEGNSRRGTLTLIRPDGTGKRELGEGEAPAWLPNNSGLVVNRGQSLWRINADGSGAVELPNTSGGGSPSVSADGRYLAYSRLLQGELDIWVLRLDGNGQ